MWPKNLLIGILLLFCAWSDWPRAIADDLNAIPDEKNILTNAAQIRAISPLEANQQRPVKLQAIVTALNPSTIFLQDATGGTFITTKSNPTAFLIGTVLDVEGVTYVGRYLPGITDAKCEIVGDSELPVAVPVGFDDLMTTKWHYTRVEVIGIVHSVFPLPEFGKYVLGVALGSRKLEVQVTSSNVFELTTLIDARVRIDGLAAGYINDRRQLVSPQLLVSRMRDLQVISPPLANPFSATLVSAANLLNFNPSGVSKHRLHVRGVVTHSLPGAAIFVRDGERGLLIQTAQSGRVNSGDIVEAVGFPAMGRFSAYLEDAEFHVVGKEQPPQPVGTTVTEALNGGNDANLISIQARVIETLENPDETLLILSSGNVPFHARLPHPSVSVRKGSSVRLTGVCRVEEFNVSGGGFGANPRSFEILLRSAADVAVIAAPSWWTSQRLGYAAGILLGLALAAFFWVGMLRRRVADQAAIIRVKVHREAMLEERHRLAREMHDTVAQSFSGLGFQLDALDSQLPPASEAARNKLETARKMVKQGQEDFRRTLLNLRAQELERGTLEKALPTLALEMLDGTGIQLECNVTSLQVRLPEAIEGNLLRISQECITNAMHHAQPRKIILTLKQNQGTIQLSIVDDGIGFDSRTITHVDAGHFGLRGMRERASQIGAKLDIVSNRGSGTIVTISLPINHESIR